MAEEQDLKKQIKKFEKEIIKLKLQLRIVMGNKVELVCDNCGRKRASGFDICYNCLNDE